MVNGVDVMATIFMVGAGFVMGFLAAMVIYYMEKDDSEKEKENGNDKGESNRDSDK